MAGQHYHAGNQSFLALARSWRRAQALLGAVLQGQQLVLSDGTIPGYTEVAFRCMNEIAYEYGL